MSMLFRGPRGCTAILMMVPLAGRYLISMKTAEVTVPFDIEPQAGQQEATTHVVPIGCSSFYVTQRIFEFLLPS